MTDITNPDYYKDYKIEVTDAIIAWKLTYSQGNIIKYIVRAGKKDSRIDDLNKALWYLKKEIGIYERPREDINAITMAMRREKNDRQDRLQSKKRKT